MLAAYTMLNVTGVDLTSLENRQKFVFVAQVGRPQKVAMEFRDRDRPAGLRMDVLITGDVSNMKTGANIFVWDASL